MAMSDRQRTHDITKIFPHAGKDYADYAVPALGRKTLPYKRDSAKLTAGAGGRGSGTSRGTMPSWKRTTTNGTQSRAKKSQLTKSSNKGARRTRLEASIRNWKHWHTLIARPARAACTAGYAELCKSMFSLLEKRAIDI